jgi:two-component system cell cycle sensor histidine kinase/response regulator CckA
LKKPSDDREALQLRLLGFGDASAHKSYYPALRRRLQDLERAQAALETSERRLQLAVEGARLGMWDYDFTTDVLGVNDQWCLMLGEPQAAATWRGREALLRVHPDDRAALQGLFTGPGAAPSDEPVTREVRLEHRDGRWITVLVRGGVIARGPDGAALRAAGTQMDITALREAEEAQRRLAAQVQHAQKLESLGVLAGGIAHDFNNLLVAVLGYAELCREDVPEGSELAENLGEICTAATRAAELTNQMLAYSGRGRFVVEPLDLSAVVHEMGRLLAVSLPKKVDLHYVLAPELPPVAADVAQLRQVVMNLVTNAADAIGQRPGAVRIATRAVEATAEDLRSAYLGGELAPGPYVALEVSDDGCGMDPTTLERLFDPFFTTKSTGRGLGMAAVLGIVRGHRASIHVESHLGVGTTFRLLFPAAAAHPRSAAAPRDAAEPQTRGARILVVDDEPSVRDFVASALLRQGWRPEVVPDGPQALARYDEGFDLVILDLTMPVMDGQEVFQRLLARDPDARVLLTSGFSAEETRQQFSDRLAGFIQKPFTVDALRRAVHAALARPRPT